MSTDLFDLSGKTAVVTGASSGLGQRMAMALASAGAKLVLVARSREGLDATAQAITQNSGEASAVSGDLSDLATIEPLAKQIAQPFGHPHILVNAAGLNPRQPADSISLEAWQETLQTNLSAPFFLARSLVPGMVSEGYGRIINIASLQSERAFPNGIAYGASKGGVAQLTRAMAEAWSSRGVTCNAIAPGFFPTSLTASVFAQSDLTDSLAAQTAIGRNGRLEDLDGLSIFLASPGASYLTGQVIYLDGGFTAK